MLYTRDQLREWKKSKTVFYLGKARWKTTHTENWKGKVKAMKQNKVGKTRWSHKDKVSENSGIITSKKYSLYYDATDKKAGTVTLEEVQVLTKSGIKVLAEKDGFAC